MADIHCPICDRLNDTNAERCWYCQAILPRDEKPAHESQDWLDGLRGDSTIPAPENSQDDSTDAAAPMDNEAEVPDWLARIRQREQTERPEQPEPSEDAASAAQDWLDDIRAGENQDEPAAAAPEQPESDPASSEPPPVDKNTQDWLKQLESWQPVG